MGRRNGFGEGRSTGVLTVRLKKDVLERLLAYADDQCQKNPKRYPSRNAYFVHKLPVASEFAAKGNLGKPEVEKAGLRRPEPKPKPGAKEARPMGKTGSLIPISDVRRYYNLSRRDVLFRLAQCHIEARTNDAGQECIHERALPKLLRPPG